MEIIVASKGIRRETMEWEKIQLTGAEKWILERERSTKSEIAHISSFRSIPMAESREEEDGVEFSLALDVDQLDNSNAIFAQGLLNL
ncbi:hypothetical protein CRYUN_Cryun27aG0011300 [Craigia yunnanensis]